MIASLSRKKKCTRLDRSIISNRLHHILGADAHCILCIKFLFEHMDLVDVSIASNEAQVRLSLCNELSRSHSCKRVKGASELAQWGESLCVVPNVQRDTSKKKVEKSLARMWVHSGFTG